MAERVFVYTTPICAYCVRAKALLKKKGIPFREVDVDADPALRRWMVEASGRRTVPEIFIDGVPIGGFTELAELDRSGELDAKLATPGVGVVPHEANDAAPTAPLPS